MTKTREEIHNDRPISPHLTIYKKQISSVLSIMHRAAGVGLFFSLAILIWYFIICTFNEYGCEHHEQFFQYNLFKVVLVFISFAWFYHLCNGIRHLVWDSGYCFSIKAINFTGWFVVVCSVLMTIIFSLLIISW